MLIVVDRKLDNRTAYVRRYADDVGPYVSIIGAWIQII